jgi:hypothetical protein
MRSPHIGRARLDQLGPVTRYVLLVHRVLALAATFAVGLAIPSCRRAEPTSETPPPTSPAPTAKPSPPADPGLAACAAMTRAECLASTGCTLHQQANNSYECLPDTGPCETDLLQEDKKGCEARPACTFVPADCYCHCPTTTITMRVPDVVPPGVGCGCACGGGPPSRCVEKPATK